MSIIRSIALVNALAKLHNFCIDQRDNPLTSNPEDQHSLITNPNGYVPLEENEKCDITLQVQIIGGGHHFQDIDRRLHQNQTLREFPRQSLHDNVASSHLVRPRYHERNNTV